MHLPSLHWDRTFFSVIYDYHVSASALQLCNRNSFFTRAKMHVFYYCHVIRNPLCIHSQLYLWILPGVKADTYSGIFTTDRADFPGCFCLSIIYRFYEKRFPCERCSRSRRTCSRRIFLYELQPVYSSQQTGYYTCA